MPQQIQTDSELIQSSRYAASIFHDDGLPLRLLQSNLTPAQRYLIRNDPQILYSLFKLRPLTNPSSNDNYYFWDSTTLSLFEIAHASIRSMLQSKISPTVLDLGCGPYAILGCALKKKFPIISVTSTDLHPNRTNSAALFSSVNNVSIEILASDLFASCTNEYDIILFNPPYVQLDSVQHMSTDLTTEESVSGIASEPPVELISRLLDQFIQLPGRPTLLLGINNYFLPHSTMMTVLSRFSVSVATSFADCEATPQGPVSQVYSLTKSC